MDRPAHGMTPEEIDAYQKRYGNGPHLAADLVVVSMPDIESSAGLRVLLVRRAHPPYQDRFALPGGFVETGEDLEDAARRELAEETGLHDLAGAWVQQLATYGMPARDPRARVVSVVYLALVPAHGLGSACAGDDASEARFFRLRGDEAIEDDGKALCMAFDHDQALRDLRARLRLLAFTSSAPLLLLASEFALEQARKIYEAFAEQQIDPAGFDRWITSQGWLEPIPGSDRDAGAIQRYRLVGRRPSWATGAWGSAR